MASKHGFEKKWRIRRRRDFLKVQKRGRKLHSTYFLVFSRPNGLAHPRLGVTVSKKVGKAVVRNYVRRCVREVFRCHKDWFPEGRDVVVVAKRHAANGSYAEFLLDLERARGRLHPSWSASAS